MKKYPLIALFFLVFSLFLWSVVWSPEEVPVMGNAQLVINDINQTERDLAPHKELIVSLESFKRDSPAEWNDSMEEELLFHRRYVEGGEMFLEVLRGMPELHKEMSRLFYESALSDNDEFSPYLLEIALENDSENVAAKKLLEKITKDKK